MIWTYSIWAFLAVFSVATSALSILLMFHVKHLGVTTAKLTDKIGEISSLAVTQAFARNAQDAALAVQISKHTPLEMGTQFEDEEPAPSRSFTLGDGQDIEMMTDIPQSWEA